MTKVVEIEWIKFTCAGLELSIMEALYSVPEIEMWYVKELIKKLIKKYSKYIDIDIIEHIIKLKKHHTSLNRFYKIAQTVDKPFSKKLFEILKRYSYQLNTKI
jgi:hypothetical protein